MIFCTQVAMPTTPCFPSFKIDRDFATSFFRFQFTLGTFVLTVPTAKPVKDFHHQVRAHAEPIKTPLATIICVVRGVINFLILTD